MSETRTIPLTQGKVAIVDIEDYERLACFKWAALRRGRQHIIWHAVRYAGGGRRNQHYSYMHREVINARAEFVVDHIDGDGLNNRRSNLRECTTPQNVRSQIKRQGQEYKGITFSKKEQKWIAQIKNESVARRIGTFDKAIDAARAYDRAAILYHGDFARINFPRSDYATQ